MNGNRIGPFWSLGRYKVTRLASYCVSLSVLLVVICTSFAIAGESLRKFSIPTPGPAGCPEETSSRGPSCGIEMTCMDRPVQLGYSDGVCFRATCPGIWALIHRRVDQQSFRRRFLTYRQYSFKGTWELKDSGVIESGVTPLRELFLVLPDDLIEFKLRDPDCNSSIEVTNLGYIKKGSVEELKKWVAYQIYLERPVFRAGESDSRTTQAGGPWYPGSAYGYSDIIINPLSYLGRSLGLPWLCR